MEKKKKKENDPLESMEFQRLAAKSEEPTLLTLVFFLTNYISPRHQTGPMVGVETSLFRYEFRIRLH